jgi:thiamine kinase-like enzyme
MKEIGGGYINSVFLNDKEIIKKYGNKSIVNGFGLSTTERFKNEHRALTTLNSTMRKDLLLPQLLDSSDVDETISMQFISGTPVEDYLIATELRDVESIMAKIAVSFKELHMIKLDVEEVDFTELYLTRLMAYLELNKEILEFENISSERIKILGNRILREPDFIISAPCYVHTDGWLNNMIITPDKNIYFLDWEFFSIGSFYEDLGTFYIYVDQFFKNNCAATFYKRYASNINDELIKFFGILRCLRLLQYVGLQNYNDGLDDGGHCHKEMIRRLKSVLETFE